MIVGHHLLVATALVALVLRSEAVAQESCPGDLDGDGAVTIDEIVRAVGDALSGCTPDSAIFIREGSIVVPGTIRGVAFAPSGDNAYVSTGTAIIELDVDNLVAARSLFIPGGNTPVTLSGLDATGTRAIVYSFDGATVVNLSDGSRSQRVGGGSSGRSVIANDKIYTPSFNGRGVVVATVQGANARTILPFPSGTGTAGPHFTVATPDESRVIFDDEFNNAIHVIDTATDQVIGSFPVGFQPLNVIALDRSLATVVLRGAVASVDLSNPTGVPQLTQLAILANALLTAGTPNGRDLVAITGGSASETGLRIAVVDTQTGQLKANELLAIEWDSSLTLGLAVAPDGSRVIVAVGSYAYVLRPEAGLLSD